MEGMNLENILSGQEVEMLFDDPQEGQEDGSTQGQEKNTGEGQGNDGKESGKKENENDNNPAEVVNPEDLFGDDEEGEGQPESVGSGEEKDKDGKEDTEAGNEGDGASPNDNFYSSIASALAVDGIFPNLNEDDVKDATDAEGFSKLIEKEVEARLDDRQKRIAKALDDGVEPDKVRVYENTLNYLDSITEDKIGEESQQGEQIRRQLIYQDFLNKGYPKEKAQKLTQRSIDGGNDIDDAKEALESNKDYFQEAYKETLREADERNKAVQAERKKQNERMEKSILEDKKLMGDIEVNQRARKQTLDNITKPTYRDTETGEYMTALQKYQKENPMEFLKNVGLAFTLTDGFKDWSGIGRGEVKKGVKKGLMELEKKLRRPSGQEDGSMSYSGYGGGRVGSSSDFGNGLRLML